MTWGCAADTRLFTPARRSERRRAALGADGRAILLHVGRLAVEKDVETLIAALRLTHAALGSAVVICVAGDGPEAARVRGELPFARHLGFLDRETLADLYADADLFLFPSPTETCGLVAVEAMASGLPVIASDRGGARESVRDGLTGRVVAAGDAEGFARAASELVRDPARRRAMGERARAAGLEHDWERELEALVERYAGVLGRDPGPARAPGPGSRAPGVSRGSARSPSRPP